MLFVHISYKYIHKLNELIQNTKSFDNDWFYGKKVYTISIHKKYFSWKRLCLTILYFSNLNGLNFFHSIERDIGVHIFWHLYRENYINTQENVRQNEVEYFYITHSKYVVKKCQYTRREFTKLGNKLLSTVPSNEHNKELRKNYMKKKRAEPSNRTKTKRLFNYTFLSKVSIVNSWFHMGKFKMHTSSDPIKGFAFYSQSKEPAWIRLFLWEEIIYIKKG